MVHASETEILKTKEKIEKWHITPVKGLLPMHCIFPQKPKLVMRETTCFQPCCYTPGGDFHPTCEGWKETGMKIKVARRERNPPEQREEVRVAGEGEEGMIGEEEVREEVNRDQDRNNTDTQETVSKEGEGNMLAADNTEGEQHKESEEQETAVEEVVGEKGTDHKAEEHAKEGKVENQSTSKSDVMEGTYIAAIYGKRWYIGKV